jgi:glycosyltransferase involved in cell wall biosynthesis
MTKLKIGIDASNLRQGGGRTHLIELLNVADPERDNIEFVIVWGSEETLALLPERPWIKKTSVKKISQGFIWRTIWQFFISARHARIHDCNIFFAPGGSVVPTFKPTVTMCRNMLPFDWKELSRYGFSITTFRLILLRFIQTFSIKNSDGVIFLTSFARNAVLSCVGPISGKSTIIQHGVNYRFTNSGNKTPRLRSINSEKIIKLIYVSKIDVYKHQWVIVEGIAIARRETGLDLRLTLIGSSYAPAMRRLQKAINRWDPEERWTDCLGHIDYDQIEKVYHSAHIVVFASSCENMPNILLEALASGLPILASNRGPMHEILGKSGNYFDPENASDFANCLVRFLDESDHSLPPLRQDVDVVEQFSWERTAIKTFSFLSKIKNANN